MSTILVKRFPAVGPPPTFQHLMVSLGTAMVPLGVVQLATCYNEQTEDRGLGEVDLVAILDPLDPHRLTLCPWLCILSEAVPCPLPPVSLAGCAPALPGRVKPLFPAPP